MTLTSLENVKRLSGCLQFVFFLYDHGLQAKTQHETTKCPKILNDTLKSHKHIMSLSGTNSVAREIITFLKPVKQVDENEVFAFTPAIKMHSCYLDCACIVIRTCQ